MPLVPNPYDMTGTLDTTRIGTTVQDVSAVSVAFTLDAATLQTESDERLQVDQRMSERTY